jgi:hypothetical protein
MSRKKSICVTEYSAQAQQWDLLCEHSYNITLEEKTHGIFDI